MMSSKSLALGSSVAVVLLLGAWFFLKPSQETGLEQTLAVKKTNSVIETTETALPKPVSAPVVPEREEEAEVQSEQTSADWNAAEFAPSLADTDIDGALTVDEHGNLEITLDLKDFYDYFFSAVGERSEEEVFAEIEKQIALRLEGEAASQAIALMHDYVAYQHAQQEVMAKQLIDKDMQDYAYYARTMSEAFHTLKDFRREFFSPEVADAFFALDETYAEYAVTVMEIQANPALSDEEKQAHIQSIEGQLPESMRAAEREANERADLAAQAKAIYDDGGSPEEIHELLADKFEPEVVDNLLAFYERETHWQERLDQYFKEKSSILDSGLSEADQGAAILSLQGTLFQDDELNRLGSEEAIAEEIARSEAKQTASS